MYNKKNSLFILFLTVGFLFADPPNWEINSADYQFNGSATSAVYLNDELVGSENDILVGFGPSYDCSACTDGELSGSEEWCIDAITGDPLCVVDGGTEVRGVVNGLYFPPTGNYTFNLMLFSNLVSGETVTFKFYHSASDQIFDLNETLDYEADMIVGNAFNTFILNGFWRYIWRWR